MKLITNTKALMDGLRKVLNVVSVRTTLPILSNVLLNTKDDKLYLSTTDLDITIKTFVEAKIEKHGQVTLPAKKMGQIISHLSSGDIHIQSDDGVEISIRCKNASFKLMGLNPTEFPQEKPINGDTIELSKMEFGKTLRKIAHSVSLDPTRPVLNGILLNIHAKKLTSVATDGRRLACVEKEYEKNRMGAGNIEIILPIKVVKELQKLLDLDDDGDMNITLSESKISFSISDTWIISKLIEGNYPNYRQVIPESFKNAVNIPRGEFFEVLNRVTAVLSDTHSPIKLKLEKDALFLHARSSEFGEANECISLSYQGDPISISLNPIYMMDPLRHLEVDTITIRFNDEFKPIILLGDVGFLYVLMPMRT